MLVADWKYCYGHPCVSDALTFWKKLIRASSCFCVLPKSLICFLCSFISSCPKALCQDQDYFFIFIGCLKKPRCHSSTAIEMIRNNAQKASLISEYNCLGGRYFKTVNQSLQLGQGGAFQQCVQHYIGDNMVGRYLSQISTC